MRPPIFAMPRSQASDIFNNQRELTGIPTLDQLTNGGFPTGEMYVVHGAPGTGKTILALHFLHAGAQKGEKVLCLTLSQRVESVQQTAASVSIDVSNIIFQDLSGAKDLHALSSQQTVFDTSELELEDTMLAFTNAIKSHQATRIVFDGISHLRMLANSSLVYRQQLFELRDYLTERNITALFTNTRHISHGNGDGDGELTAIAHGAISLFSETTEHGVDHRYLHITKIRGSNFQPGKHDMEIADDGIHIYPVHEGPIKQEKYPQAASINITSGLPALDTLLGDGLQTGTSCLLIGPSGTGKTSIATLFAHHFAQQGGKASIFLFDELMGTFLTRSKALGMDIEPYIDHNDIRFHELSFRDMTLGKFTSVVTHDVEEWGARIVVIDTLTGYLNSMPSEQRLVSQVHELLMSLNRRGVLTLLVVAQHGVIGPDLSMAVDVSYIADTVLLLRHFEAAGALRQAISVYKKRYGIHEKRIREVRLQPNGIQIGAPLDQFTGILSGMPQYTGDGESLIECS